MAITMSVRGVSVSAFAGQIHRNNERDSSPPSETEKKVDAAVPRMLNQIASRKREREEEKRPEETSRKKTRFSLDLSEKAAKELESLREDDSKEERYTHLTRCIPYIPECPAIPKGWKKLGEWANEIAERAQVFSGSDNFKMADKLFQMAEKNFYHLMPSNHLSCFAFVKHQLGEFEEAERLYELIPDPGLADIDALVRVKLKLQKYDEAKKLMKKFAERNADILTQVITDTIDFIFLKALVYKSLEKYEKSNDFYNEAFELLELDPFYRKSCDIMHLDKTAFSQLENYQSSVYANAAFVKNKLEKYVEAAQLIKIAIRISDGRIPQEYLELTDSINMKLAELQQEEKTGEI